MHSPIIFPTRENSTFLHAVPIRISIPIRNNLSILTFNVNWILLALQVVERKQEKCYFKRSMFVSHSFFGSMIETRYSKGGVGFLLVVAAVAVFFVFGLRLSMCVPYFIFYMLVGFWTKTTNSKPVPIRLWQNWIFFSLTWFNVLVFLSRWFWFWFHRSYSVLFVCCFFALCNFSVSCTQNFVGVSFYSDKTNWVNFYGS